MKITYLGHAALAIEVAGKQLIVDPFISPNPLAKDIDIEALEAALGCKAQVNLCPPQAGDVPGAWAEQESLLQDIDFQPSTPLEEGIRRFVAWYRDYHGTP